jgi:hypothetical protein
MAKKCIPGVICIENMTLFVLFLILLLIAYLYYTNINNISNQNKNDPDKKIYVVSAPSIQSQFLGPLASISARLDPFNDPYYPPLKTDALFYPPNSSDIRGMPLINPGVPINMQTRGLNTGFQQIGILTRNGSNNDMILPLMGRRVLSGRDKWQFYTISNTGSLNTKLPIKINGRSCTTEYGCDDINSGDTVYVEGYSENFSVTKYENNSFQYIPVL